MRNPNFDPGEMDKRISIMREVKEEDGYGGQEVVERIDVFGPMWAKVEAGAPAERYNHDQVYNTETVTFTIRNRTGILESDIIVYAGVDYNIRAIPTINPRDRFIEIEAERGVGV